METELLLSFLRSKLGRCGPCVVSGNVETHMETVVRPCLGLKPAAILQGFTCCSRAEELASGSPSDAARSVQFLCAQQLRTSHTQNATHRYQQQGEKLQVENFKLSDELDAQKLNLRDINEFLTNELKARTATNAVLDERVALLTQRMEDLRRTSEVRYMRLFVCRVCV